MIGEYKSKGKTGSERHSDAILSMLKQFTFAQLNPVYKNSNSLFPPMIPTIMEPFLGRPYVLQVTGILILPPWRPYFQYIYRWRTDNIPITAWPINFTLWWNNEILSVFILR